jgi:hypothetical protein
MPFDQFHNFHGRIKKYDYLCLVVFEPCAQVVKPMRSFPVKGAFFVYTPQFLR